MHVNEETAQAISELIDRLVIQERMAAVNSYRGKRALCQQWQKLAAETQVALADRYGLYLDYDGQARQLLELTEKPAKEAL